ncbi:16 kDa [Spodoptera frugiperda ascovirus 1a]|uniref:16 kDa n=1 Tax=Spodoptera frugiperda ascovirus 1a TaxID=113370 RepID=Q0E4Y6_SFAVA|nr:16 kDa [Spodoptera frugiperda ascovirus 1a]CAL44715.1 16 kDa [Spodoptera frugiperda ascovirus 1a]
MLQSTTPSRRVNCCKCWARNAIARASSNFVKRAFGMMTRCSSMTPSVCFSSTSSVALTCSSASSPAPVNSSSSSNSLHRVVSEELLPSSSSLQSTSSSSSSSLQSTSSSAETSSSSSYFSTRFLRLLASTSLSLLNFSALLRATRLSFDMTI